MGTRRRKWKKVGFCILVISFVGILTSVLQFWNSSTRATAGSNMRYRGVIVETETHDENLEHIKAPDRSASEYELLQLEIQTTVTNPIIMDGGEVDYEIQKPILSLDEFIGNKAQDSDHISSLSELFDKYKNRYRALRNESGFGDTFSEPLQNGNQNNLGVMTSDQFLVDNDLTNFNRNNSVDKVSGNETNYLREFAEADDSLERDISSLERDISRNDFAGFQNDLVLALPTKPAKTTGNIWHNHADNEFASTAQIPDVNVPSSGQVMVVSMSLYGSDPRYTAGTLRNADLIKENFPGWRLRVYMESPSLTAPRFPRVPSMIIATLKSLGVDIHYVVPEQDFIPPMMWRFLVADDLSVDYFIIRDSDSRLTDRDFAAVSAWMKSGKPFHSIRDHPSHANYAVSGGLWGGKTRELRDILRRSWVDLMRGASSEYLEDMNFLNNIIWPKVQVHAYCSDSVSCDQWPNSYPFPVPRYGYDHVGQVFDQRDIGRPIDIRILRSAGENPRCTNMTVL